MTGRRLIFTDPVNRPQPLKGANVMHWILWPLLFVAFVGIVHRHRHILRANERLYRRCIALEVENRRLNAVILEQQMRLAEQHRPRSIQLPIVMYGTLMPN